MKRALVFMLLASASFGLSAQTQTPTGGTIVIGGTQSGGNGAAVTITGTGAASVSTSGGQTTISVPVPTAASVGADPAGTAAQAASAVQSALQPSIAANGTAITTETTRATTAEGVNSGAITAESGRAKGAEGTNSTNISSETSRATAAEGANATAISNETSRALPNEFPAANTAGLPGYQRQVAYGQAATRDTVLSDGCLSPANAYGALGMGGNQNGDERTAINLAIMQVTGAVGNAGGAAVSAQTPSNPIVCGRGKTYRVASPGGYALLPRDFGDYLGTQSWASGATSQVNNAGNGAQVTFTINPAGQITACSIYGGTGYNPNAYLPIQIIDTSHQGSGAAAYGTTNASGVPNSCVMQQKGMAYPQTGGTVQGIVFPIGADGASATATLSGGTFTSTTGTVVSGGNGYTSAPAAGFYVAATGLQCTTYPTASTTVSAGAVATVTLNSVGAGCTYNGQASATVPILIGASVGGVQATNLAPEPANEIPVGILLHHGLVFDGENASIYADRPAQGVDLNEIAVMADPWGDESHDIVIRNVNLCGMFPLYFAGKAQNILIDHVKFCAPTSNLVTYTPGDGGTIGIYFAQVGANVVVQNSDFYGNAGIVCGGNYNSRTGGNGGLGSIGGTDVSYQTSTAQGNACDGLIQHNNHFYGIATTPNQIIYYPSGPFSNPTGKYQNSRDAALDTFWETYFWKSQNSPVAAVTLNGTGNCLTTTTAAIRTVDANWGASKQNWPCFQGITDTMETAISRNFYLSRLTSTDLFRDYGQRPMVQGTFVGSTFTGFYQPNGYRSYTDPYLNSGVSLGAIVGEQYSASVATAYNHISGINTPNMPMPFNTFTNGTEDCIKTGCTGWNPNFFDTVSSGTLSSGIPSVTATGTVTSPSVPANSCLYTNTNGFVPGAYSTDRVLYTSVSASQTGPISVSQPILTGNGQIKVQFCNNSASAVTPVAETVSITLSH